VTGLPLFLTSYVPGQEEGNVKFVVDSKVGFYVRPPRKLVAAVRRAFVEDRQGFDRMRGHADRLGRADAAAEIALLVAAAIDPPTQPD
ncbi:MAG: hypothetical protein ACYDGR_03810, partial [Candidatus Dormibacteria bacterium]